MNEDQIREVYSADNLIEAEYIQNLLTAADIESRIDGEHLQLVSGKVPAQLVAPGIMIHADDFDRAKALIEEANRERHHNAESSQQWTCSHCGEKNEANFEICWSCQQEDETQLT